MIFDGINSNKKDNGKRVSVDQSTRLVSKRSRLKTGISTDKLTQSAGTSLHRTLSLSVQKTYQLWLNYKSLRKVSFERGLKPKIIKKHLGQCFKQGYEFDQESKILLKFSNCESNNEKKLQKNQITMSASQTTAPLPSGQSLRNEYKFTDDLFKDTVIEEPDFEFDNDF